MSMPHDSKVLSKWFSQTMSMGYARWGTLVLLVAICAGALVLLGDRNAVAQRQHDAAPVAEQSQRSWTPIEALVFNSSITRQGEATDGFDDGPCPQETVTHSSHQFTSGSFVAQLGFVAQEVAAVTFTVPAASFPLRIDRVDGLFGTSSLSVQTTTHWTLMVWEGEPNTGNLLCTVAGCTITSDGDNPPHMVVGPPNNALLLQAMVDPGDPDQIIVTNNGSNKFSVGFRIDQMNNPPTQSCTAGCIPAPCCPHNQNSNIFPTTDTNGLQQATQNWLYARPGCGPCAAPGGWYTVNQVGITSDWNIRALFTPAGCVTPVGACCLAGGQCLSDLTSGQCAAQSGTYQGDNTTCGSVNCPVPTGTCCLANGNCIVATTADCATQGGTFVAQGQICNVNTCRGACCVPATQQCVFTTEVNCTAANGVFQGIGTTCTGTCFGACCLPSGGCVMAISATDCTSQGGTYQGGGVQCANANCPQPLGACCLGTNCLADLSESDCEVGFGGKWLGANSNCGFNPCDPLGACCLGTSCLTDLTETDCTIGFGGVWQGAQSTCSPNPCSQPSCPADIAPPGGNGVVNVQDMLAVINGWGPCGAPCPPACAADVNNNCIVNVQDLLSVINAWGQCP